MIKIVYPPEMNWRVDRLHFAGGEMFGSGPFVAHGVETVRRPVLLRRDGTFVKVREDSPVLWQSAVFELNNPYLELPGTGEDMVRPLTPGATAFFPMYLLRVEGAEAAWYAGWTDEDPSGWNDLSTVVYRGPRGAWLAAYTGPTHRRLTADRVLQKIRVRRDDDTELPVESAIFALALDADRVLTLDVDGAAEVHADRSGAKVELFDLGREVREAYPKSTPTVLGVAVSPVSRLVAVVWSCYPARDNILVVYDAAAFEVRRLMEVPFETVEFAPDGNTVWGIGDGNTMRRTVKSRPLEVYGVDLD